MTFRTKLSVLAIFQKDTLTMCTVTEDHASAPHGNFVPSLIHFEKPKTMLKMNPSFCKYVSMSISMTIVRSKT